MFMITASTVLASVFMTLVTILVLVDQEHRVRIDRIVDKKPATYWQPKNWNIGGFFANISKLFSWRKKRLALRDLEENERLLS